MSSTYPSYTYMIVHKCQPYMMYYIGSRKSKNKDIYKDNYWGSSRTLKKEIEKNGPEKFQKIILKQFESYEDALNHEIELHEKFDVAANPLFYNKAKATSTGFTTEGTTHSDETKKNISDSLKGNSNGKGYVHTDEEKKKISDSLKGKPKSDETRKNMSIAQKGNSNSKGYIHIAETRKNMSDAKKGNSNAKGKKWKWTAEQKKKHSIAQKARRAREIENKINNSGE